LASKRLLYEQLWAYVPVKSGWRLKLHEKIQAAPRRGLVPGRGAKESERFHPKTGQLLPMLP